MSVSTHPIIGLAFALTAACGPQSDTTSASTSDTSTTAAGTTTTGSSATSSSTADAPTTSTSTSTTGAPSTTGQATSEDANPCGCADDEVCVQSFDGQCGVALPACLPNPDGCVPGYPCAAACQPFCGGDHVDACNNSDCPGEIEGAVHCFGS